MGNEGEEQTSNMERGKEVKADIVMQAKPGDVVTTLESAGASI
jgi:hypothetical protein